MSTAYFSCERCGSTRDANSIFSCSSCGTVFCQSCGRSGEYWNNGCPRCNADGYEVGIIDADRANRQRY